MVHVPIRSVRGPFPCLTSGIYKKIIKSGQSTQSQSIHFPAEELLRNSDLLLPQNLCLKTAQSSYLNRLKIYIWTLYTLNHRAFSLLMERNNITK